MKRTLALMSILALGLALASGSVALGQGQAPPVNFTIAFIGDQGLGASAEAVLRLIQAEGAEAVIHSGDFDYADNPAAWDSQINAILGENFPYFASIGNHDVRAFFTAGGYQDRLEARMMRLGIPWKGDLGVRSSFRYQGIFFVFTAPGVFLPLDLLGKHRTFIRQELAADDSMWRIASWHKNMRRMQVGGKPDETGWGVYEAARRGGAIIATAHEHSYSRTHLLRSVSQRIVASRENTLVLSRDNPATRRDEGRSFVFVSGLGGQSIRDQQRCLPTTSPYGCNGEWASIYASDQAANFGALFGTFNYDGDPFLARFYFKDIDGHVPDDFLVRAGAATSSASAGRINLQHLFSYLGYPGAFWDQQSARRGLNAGLMKRIVAQLTEDDIVNVAATSRRSQAIRLRSGLDTVSGPFQ